MMGDEVTLSYGKASRTIKMEVGHVMGPLISKWKVQKWGAELDPRNPDDKVTVLAYADDVTVFTASKNLAAIMLEEMSHAL